MKDKTTQERCPYCGSDSRLMHWCGNQLHHKNAHPFVRRECFKCRDPWHDTPAPEQRSAPVRIIYSENARDELGKGVMLVMFKDVAHLVQPGGERAAELRTTIHKSGCAIFGPMVNCEPAKCDCGAELRNMSPSTDEQAIWDAVNHYAPKTTESVASPQEGNNDICTGCYNSLRYCDCAKTAEAKEFGEPERPIISPRIKNPSEDGDSLSLPDQERQVMSNSTSRHKSDNTGDSPSGQRVSVASKSQSCKCACHSILGVLPCPDCCLVASESRGAREQIYATDIARELYDRFVMGGWEPVEAHAWLRTQLVEYAAEVKQETESRVSALREKLALTESQLRAKDIIAANLAGKLEYAIERFTEIAKMGMPGQMRERAKAALADLSPLAKPEVEAQKEK